MTSYPGFCPLFRELQPILLLGLLGWRFAYPPEGVADVIAEQ